MTLLGKRNTLKGHLTRLEDYVTRVSRDEASFTAADIYTKLTTLEGIKAQVEVLHEEMLNSGIDEDQENEQHQMFLERLNCVETFLKNVLGRKDVEEEEEDVDEDYDNGDEPSHSPIPKDTHSDTKHPVLNSLDLSNIEKALATLLQHQVNAELRSQSVMEKLGEVVTTSIQPPHDSESRGSVKSKLPNIEIPKFSGNYVDWPPFRDMFINIVHLDRNLSDVQRMHYLVTNVDGNAKKMIKTLRITNANYRVAWDVLSNHFEDQASVIHEHIKGFCDLLPISTPTRANFTELVVTAKSILDALDALEVTSRDPWVIYLLLDKLDHETKILWSREIQNSAPTLPTFMTFLQGRMKSIERYQPCPSKPTTNHNKPSSAPISKFNRNSSTVLATPSQSECIACDQSGHPIFKCPTFLKMDSADRLELIRKFNRCRKCLTQNHQTRDCTFYSCRKCEGHHNTLLHGSFGPSRPDLRTPTETIRDQTQNPSKSTVATTTDKSEEQPPIPSPPTDQPNDNAVITSTTSTQSRKRVFLETAIVRILDKYGVPHQCRALLDSGAQVNLLSQSLFQKLKLPKSMSNTFIGRVVDGGSTSRFQTDCNIQSQDGETHFTMTCQIVPSVLQQKLPNWEVSQQEIPIPSGIELADPTWYFPQVIDLLIGNEFYNEIYTDRILRLGSGFPVMKDSCFGWILSGPYTTLKPNQPIVCVATTLASIDSSLKRFWEAEEIDSPRIKAPDHETVENIFQTTTSRDSTGRFIVQVPFKPTLVRLHDNLPNATRQLLHLEKRLASKPALRQLYHAAMQENLDLGFFEEVPPHEVNKPSFYMPHHCVTKHSPTGPKIRIVMNASSKSQTGLSLNDVAMMGPTVQPDILTILLRFREHPFAFSCDITKMYPQVLIHPPHRDFHRILWRFNPSEPIRHFRARGVCFGVTSSPYLATRVLVELSTQSQTLYPLASQALRQNFYVDDCLKSFPSIEEALNCKTQLVKLLGSAGMSLAKWCANDMRILGNSSQSEGQDLLPDLSKALGMQWHPQEDIFSYQLSKDFSQAQSKREILAAVASLYDPLGLIAPVIVIGKLILQDIWKEDLGWDQPVTPAIIQRWQEFSSNLSQIQDISIQRPLRTIISSAKTSIHIFCDSSSVAYGAVAYMVTSNESGPPSSKIIVAKSRIAPVKVITIPKLELCAALMGARLLHKIQEALPSTEYYLWTDSSIVLGQIRSNKIRLDPFTNHRISEIQNLTDVTKWQHVPGNLNPADIVSRGAFPSELRTSHLWWKGPDFLLKGIESWPVDPYLPMVDASLVAEESQTPDPHPIEYIMKSTNNFSKMKRILAYVLRFSSPTPSTGPLTIPEIHKAEFKLISYVQSRYLPEVKEAIANGSLSKSKQFASVKQLSPFLDSQGLIRVGGRLSQAREHYDLRHPLLIPKCDLAKCIAMDIHRQNLHAGPQLLLSTMRQRYWPLGGRNLTRKVVKTCITCWRQNPILQSQQMGDLPAARVNHTAPFAICGVDFCGPFLTRPNYRRGGVSYKTYICVFVCFTTKAVHLEVVGNLTTESFLAALRRFVARRAVPDEIYCDNATNFRGAHATLSALLKNVSTDPQFLQETLAKEIKWRFNPPRTPHHGGLYEAVVKSLKHHLVREIGQTILTFEELTTVVAQVESILNSRPIAPLSEDPTEALPLTPGHFLVGRPLNQLPERNLVNVSPNAVTRWQLCQKLLQHFSHRWKTEYLHTLQQRNKWQAEFPNLDVGDIVVVCDDQSPSHSWPLGIIQEVHLGKDGRCRVVRVKTTKGVYTRGIQKIARLPIEGLPPSASPPGAC